MSQIFEGLENLKVIDFIGNNCTDVYTNDTSQIGRAIEAIRSSCSEEVPLATEEEEVTSEETTEIGSTEQETTETTEEETTVTETPQEETTEILTTQGETTEEEIIEEDTTTLQTILDQEESCNVYCGNSICQPEGGNLFRYKIVINSK